MTPETARKELLLRQPDLGYLALMLVICVVEDHPSGTAATDGTTLWIVSSWWDALSVADRLFVLGHEVAHCALGHPWRLAQLPASDRRLIAADLAVNSWLASTGWEPPSSALIPADYGLPAGLSALEYYRRLPNTPEAGGGTGCDGEGCCVTPGTADGGAPSPDAIAAATERWARAVADATVRRRMAGHDAGAWDRAQEHAAPPYDWTVALDASLSALAVRARGGAEEWSWAHLPRRPGFETALLQPGLVRVVPVLAVAIDTSGSMGDHTVARAVATAADVIATHDLDTMVCTADAIVQTMATGLVPKLLGGGGTAFGPAILWAQEQGADALLYITDGIGEYPPTPPRGLHVTWLLVDSVESTPPWGDCVRCVTGQ